MNASELLCGGTSHVDFGDERTGWEITERKKSVQLCIVWIIATRMTCANQCKFPSWARACFCACGHNSHWRSSQFEWTKADRTWIQRFPQFPLAESAVDFLSILDLCHSMQAKRQWIKWEREKVKKKTTNCWSNLLHLCAVIMTDA